MKTVKEMEKMTVNTECEFNENELENVNGGIFIAAGAVALVSGLYAAAIGTSYGLAKISYNNAKRK